MVALAMAVAGSLVSAGLIPGGGPQRTDCYVEASVQGVDSPGPQVQSNRIVLCTDGDPCDTDGTCGNDSCTLRVAVCADQKLRHDRHGDRRALARAGRRQTIRRCDAQRC
jgi:hypothetical protein